MKKVVYRMTENDLHKMIEESVKKALNEIGDTEKGQFALGAVRGRAKQKAHKEYASDKPNYDKADKYIATSRLAGGTALDGYDKAIQGEKGSAEGFEKGSKLRNAYHKGREYGKSSVKESSKQINEMNEGDDLQSMIFNAMKSIDEAIMDCQKGNCKAVMFNLPYVKQVLKYLSRTL